MRRARGAALLLVMWLIALLAALVGAFAFSARIEHLQGTTLSRGVVADQAARAGMEYAMTRLVETDANIAWIPDGRTYEWPFEGATVVLRIVDETGKVDLNAAEVPLLAALLRSAGAERGQANQVAGAIVDWRDEDILSQPGGGAEDPQYAEAGLPYGAKDAPFETVAEVQQVLGMTPALYAKLEPHLTVHSGQAQPDERFADPVVLAAMGLDPATFLAQRERGGATGADGSFLGGGSGTYSIDSRARLSDRREAVLRVVVRAGGSGVPGSAYTPLRWEEGASAR